MFSMCQVFDLKGSMRGRYVSHNPKKDSKGDVLMDENFLECMFHSTSCLLSLTLTLSLSLSHSLTHSHTLLLSLRQWLSRESSP